MTLRIMKSWCAPHRGVGIGAVKKTIFLTVHDNESHFSECATTGNFKITLLGTSGVDPDPNWIRIQDLCGFGSTQVQ